MGDVRGGISVTLPLGPDDKPSWHWIAFGWVLGSILTLIALFWALHRIVVGPLERLRNASKDRETRDHIGVVARTSNDEIGMLADTLETMSVALYERAENLEEQVRVRTAELEQANQEVRDFAFTVSHDLRAPLTNLTGFSHELVLSIEELKTALEPVLETCDPDVSNGIRDLLGKAFDEPIEFIKSSAGRMGHQIQAILKLSQVGRRLLKPELLDVSEIVANCIKALTHQIDERGVLIRVGTLPDVVTDRMALEQVFANLLSNAVIYLDPSRTGEIEISGEATTEVTFSVADNGRGIAADKMDSVFAPFQRAGATDVPGEGMGLAFVRTVVRRCGGRIWCESELGVGTTFHVAFPLGQDASSETEP